MEPQTRSTEEWKIIKCCPDYMISNIGKIIRIDTQKEISQHPNIWGYLMVLLISNGIRKNFAVHRLVALTFIGPRPFKKEINHIDGIKKNNYFENLEYVTRSENRLHAYRIGIQLPTAGIKGEKNINAKLTESAVVNILSLLNEGVSKEEIARRFKVSSTNIRLIAFGKAWKHITHPRRVS